MKCANTQSGIKPIKVVFRKKKIQDTSLYEKHVVNQDV